MCIGDRERRLIVDGHHAANLALAHGHEVLVLVMEFVDQPAAARIGMLLDLRHEGPIHQAVDLLDLFRASANLK